MTTRAPDRLVPPSFSGSLPEFLVFEELNRRGLREGADFIFQSSALGGRLFRGGVIIDFDFITPPTLAFNVQGVFFHYEQGNGVLQNDRMARAQLAAIGKTLIFLDEDDIYLDVEYIVGDGLRFIDHSRLGR